MYVNFLCIFQGVPGCTTGSTVMVTGVLESLQRQEAEEIWRFIKATKSVSKNTSYILAGDDAKLSKVSPRDEYIHLDCSLLQV